jgi:uncharacterized protein YlzI (FlbEa/FlbD family)
MKWIGEVEEKMEKKDIVKEDEDEISNKIKIMKKVKDDLEDK